MRPIRRQSKMQEGVHMKKMDLVRLAAGKAPLADDETPTAERWYGVRFGYLTVIKIKKKPERHQPRMCECKCNCGRVVELPWYEVKNNRIKTCEHEDCRFYLMEQLRADVRAGVKSVVIERLQAEWFCFYPDEGCPISSVAHICCRECDKTNCAFRCQNKPEQCGGAERRKK